MQSLVITGTTESIENYISKFIIAHSVSPFNIIRYNTGVKIADVRSIQKLLSIKRSKSQMILVVLAGIITTEAQNSLLKTLEEPFENVSIFILESNTNNLIPTVLSRCRLVNVQDKSFNPPTVLDKKYEILMSGHFSYSQFAQLIDSLSDSISKDDYDKFIINTRAILLNSPHIISSSYISLIQLLKNLLENYTLVKNNNINVRLALESACLKSIAIF